MSFFSALTIFYPGRPLSLSVSDLHGFCNALRTSFVSRDWLLGVQLQYGEADAAAFDATHEIQWDETCTVGTLPLEEDRLPEQWHHKGDKTPWETLWPEPDADARTVHRAEIGLGSLSTVANRDLTLWSTHDPRSGITPDSLSVGISPAYAMTLGTEVSDDADICYGLLELSFSGNGYFTWQSKPLDAYWRAAGQSATVQTALRLCRETFPVPTDYDLDPMRQALGDRFLNRNDYRLGDWVVSVSETG